MTLRRSDSLPTRLRVIPVPLDSNQNSIPDSTTVPDFNHTPVREEIIATWKSLYTDVNNIKNGFTSRNGVAGRNAVKKESITNNSNTAFICNNRNVRKKITYDNRNGGEGEHCVSVPLEPGQNQVEASRIETGTSSTRRRNLLQRLFSWKTQECDCKQRYMPKYTTPRLRPENFLCTCGASVNRINLPNTRISTKNAERARSKSVGYETAREVAQFRRLVAYRM